MERSLEELFAELEQQTGGAAAAGPAEPAEPAQPAADVLDLRDPAEQHAQQAFEQIDRRLRALPKLQNSFDALAAQQRPLRSPQQPAAGASAADDWFLLPKPDRATRDRAQRDLLLLRHRAALDPKRHYKKDRWQVPERFAIGTVVEDSSEFYSSRLTNRQRKATMLETLMADEDTTRYFKRKYTQIQLASTSGRKAHYRASKARRRHRS
ncbi:hypothetical protein HG536_0B06470 [Torulaspora globosa]|uniref:Fcf2 pre-rRNA processing C-terminal domain-containing protein n=1 Tax=Torulaspora globosa TaxID=48254 RepID=A0A7G3ZE43_9SACH|nr:uncharacterized protein HG536_0B06470 [Torulaspora globosa]QLL31779.1 hypothetical protein HG536_0B06470 [Torulaspora globosa]